MKKIEIEESIEIKKQILVEFDKYCKELGIKYSLAYGSLLGAIRHEGMIPWDDDIDVAMPRDDFDRLERIWSTSKSSRYRFLTHRTNPNVNTKIGYFYDNNTISIYGNVINDDLCIHIDVYPVDIVRKTDIKNPIFKCKREFYQFVSRAHSVHPELRTGYRRILMSIIKKVFSIIDEGKALDKLNQICYQKTHDSLNEINSDKRFSAILVENGQIKLLPFDIFEKIEMFEYENGKYPCFLDYDKCLKSWYGDYMILPPISERKRPSENSIVKFYWK